MPLQPRADVADQPGHAPVDVSLTWLVEAPRDVVWSHLTCARELALWLGRLVSGSVTADASFVVDHGRGQLCTSRVLSLDAPRSLEVTWDFPDEPPSRLALEVEDASSPCASVVHLRHTGLGELAAAYRTGWCVHLTYLEGAATGAPLPPAMFWPLHATLTALCGN